MRNTVRAAACAALLLAACGPDAPPPATATPKPSVPRATSSALVAGPGATAHDLYATKGIGCDACHPCGKRLPGGHAQPWMDSASASFHAYSANSGLAACTACHGPALDGVGGSVSISCAQCHGASWRTECSLCHGGPDGAAPPRTTWGHAGDALRVGAHAAHLSATHGVSKPVSCGACHVVPADALAPGHADGVAGVAFSGLAVPPVGTPAWDRAQATCASTYCHGGRAGGSVPVPLWTRTDGSDRACGACHGAPPPVPHPANADCGACHPGYAAGAVNVETHVNGLVELGGAGLTCSSCHGGAQNAAPPYGTRGELETTTLAVGAHQQHLGGGSMSAPVSCETCHAVPADLRHADGVVEVAAAVGWSRETATCTTACHGAFSPVWTQVDGTQAACGTCHLAPPPAPHSQNPACANCHEGYTQTSVNVALHLDGDVDVKALACNSCHGSEVNAAPPLGTGGETDATARAVGAHQAHLAGGALRGPMECAECHVVPASMDHADGAVQLTFGPLSSTGGATPAWDPQTLTCASTYCHGAVLRGGGTNQAPVWTGGASQAACGTCHLAPPPPPHPRTQICDNCHPGYTLTSVDAATHINGVVEATNLTCSSCHGDNSRVLVMQADPLAIAAPPYGSRGETDSASRSVGQHQAHVNRGNGIAIPNKCRYCHAVPTTFDHADGTSQVTFGSLATMDDATPTFDGQTCSNTYCHGSTLGRGGTDHSPTWTNPSPVGCTTCHGAPPPAPHPQDSDCIRCHPGYTETSVRKATHVNGVSDFPSGCNSCHDTPPMTGEHLEHLHERVACDRCHAGYTATTENPALHRNARQDVTLSGWDPVRRTCSNLSCHGGEYWGRTGQAARQSCNQCHGVPPASGEHFEHSEYACSRCHGTGYSTTTTNAMTHMNSVADVPFAFYNRTTRTCSSTGCHGAEYWGTPKPVTPNCANCHGFPPGLPHPQDSACQSCHPSMQSSGVLTEAHNDGTLDIAGEGCQSCHGAPPTSTRSGGVHTTDTNCYGCHSTTVDASNQVVPNGTHNDGYVQVGGGGVGTYGCQSCHGDQARQAPAGADAHVKSAPPLGTRGEAEATTRAVGAHLAHVSPAAGTLAGPAQCGECHAVPTSMSHAMGSVVMQFGGRATLQGAAPVFDPVAVSCSSTYCHGATLGAGGSNHAPAWTGGAAEAACGTCHGAPPPAPHTQSTSCGGCHEGYTATNVNLATHVNGAVELSAMACNSCHGSGINAAPPSGTQGETLTTSLAVGAHQQHLQGGAYSNPIACSECHVPPTSLDHADGTAQLAFGALATTGGAVPAWDPITGTCSSSYCHGQFVGGDLLNAPSWTTVNGTQAACGTCHGAPPQAPHTASTACGSCHTGYTQTSVNLATHVNGIVEAVASPHAAGWAEPAQHGKQVNLTGLTGCKSCHGDLGATSSCGTCHASAGFATWDTSCTFCHGSTATGRQNPPVDIQGRTVATNVSVGVHEAHATTTIATAVACTQCHPARTASVTTDTAHIDGNGVAEVVFGALAKTGGANATYTRSSATSATCASTYCHGRFSGGVNSGSGATVGWTSTTQVGCTSCHGNPPSSGRHSKHSGSSFRCTNCHNAVVNSSNGFVDRTLHVNGADNVKFGGTYNSRTVTGTWNPTSRSCSGLSCHGSESW
ncbi:CxxxxCH/CxxCH domain-containing protein [Anaeromyxobacter sp. Fw109-5]|uniref:CxxxxCH/CxxCH domain c-type cytochrome n=1 Tax=Anaeromyxobacter sp. (strain Fw109-5) TaxID=404589 RepID=UPI0000ED825A|nr:CxxxxCH/CxxCH domain-containing protein [Anaeromyxobacter sp. Fw109-5]ABS26029.1 cytochrome C family protein [Anaeromyxobacter sp. Fw109-5]